MSRIASAILVLLLSGVVALKIGDLSNTLQAHPQWSSAKSRLKIGTVGSHEFVSNRNTLAHQRLDLGKWHGHHEVNFKSPFNFASARLRFSILKNAYLVLTMRASDGGGVGIRISRNKSFPSSLLSFDSSGRFTAKKPIDLPPLDGGWQDLKVVRSGRELILTFNGDQRIAVATDLPEPVFFGLKGSKRPALIDTVSLEATGGQNVLFEDFMNKRGFGRYFLLALALLAFVNLLMFRKPKEAVLLNASLLASVLIFSLIDRVYFAEKYTGAQLFLPQSFHDQLFPERKRKVNKGLDASVDSTPGLRIMAMGSSQTYGEGVSSLEKTWAGVLQRKLRERQQGMVTVLNTGIQDLKLKRALEEYRSSWSRWKPNILVVDFGNNDSQTEDFSQSLEELVQLNRSMGTKTLLILEPSDFETSHSDRQRDRLPDMLMVVEKFKTPFFNMDLYFNSPEVLDSGFLWWDHVHMTDYGYELFAEKVIETMDQFKMLSSRR